MSKSDDVHGSAPAPAEVGAVVGGEVRDKWAWLVVFKRDTDPVEVTPFSTEKEARHLFDSLACNWTETYLCRIVDGPRDMIVPAAPAPERHAAIVACYDSCATERDRLRAEFASLKAALDKARADLAEAEKARDYYGEGRSAALDELVREKARADTLLARADNAVAALAAERTAHEATKAAHDRRDEETRTEYLARIKAESALASATARVAALEGAAEPKYTVGVEWGVEGNRLVIAKFRSAFRADAAQYASLCGGYRPRVIDLSTPAPSRPESGADKPEAGPFQEVTYTNHRGETRVRSIKPRRVWYGTTKWHPEAQWFVDALDEEKGEERSFALEDFGQPAPASDGALRRAAEDILESLGPIEKSYARARCISVIEDRAVRDLCERHGYGAVMDSAARLWSLKDPVGCKTVGPCFGVIEKEIVALRAALSASAPSEGEGSGTGQRLDDLERRVKALEMRGSL